jgi:hypothetical protein
MGRPGPSIGSAARTERAAKGSREGRAVRFTKADVSRALRGAAAAGHEPKEVRITPGEIRVLFYGCEADSPVQEDNAAYFARMLGHGPG